MGGAGGDAGETTVAAGWIGGEDVDPSGAEGRTEAAGAAGRGGRFVEATGRVVVETGAETDGMGEREGSSGTWGGRCAAGLLVEGEAAGVL